MIENPVFLAVIGDFNFLYFSGVLFLICVIAVLVASYMSPAPDLEKIKGLTYAAVDKKALRESYTKGDLIATGITLALIIGMYCYFSFWI